MDPTVFFKCLSDSTRLSCIVLIQESGEICVCDLVLALKESQPKISRHLAQLRRCGLLTSTKKEQWVFYSIKSDLPKWAKNILNEIHKTDDPQLNNIRERLKYILNEMNCC